jgi:hypothetical protein
LFLKQADIGDLLLFRGKNFGAKITRTYTGGDIDHVAMILKFDAERKEVFFLDATSNRVRFLGNKWSLHRVSRFQGGADSDSIRTSHIAGNPSVRVSHVG